jgi:hypothetical protein
MDKRTSCSLTTILLLMVLVFALLALAMVWMVRQSMTQAQQALQPITDISQGLGTQVAQVMHPTPTIIPDPVTIIHSVRTLARLETIQYSVEKVITAEMNQGVFGSLIGDKLLLVAHGVVIAGIDLEKLGPQDLWLQNGVLYVRLPAPEIFVTTLDNEKSYVYDRATGLFTWGNKDLETTARRAAEAEILKAAIDDGILNLAQQNAENYLSRLLRDLKYPDVIFVRPEVTPTPQP